MSSKYTPIFLALLSVGFSTQAQSQTVCTPLSDGVTMCDLEDVTINNGGFSQIPQVSADGSTVIFSGQNGTSTEHRAHIWRPGDTSLTELGTFMSDNSGSSYATSMSADGSTVVGYAQMEPGFQRAFVWRAGDTKITDLGTLKDDNTGGSMAYAVSADGSTVVGDAHIDGNASYNQAFVWREGDTKMTGLGTLRTDGSGQSHGYAVSADGSTVIGRSQGDESENRVFVWREGDAKMSDLGTLKSDNSGFAVSSGFGLSADGSTIVGQADTDLWNADMYMWDRHAFVMRTGDTEMTDLGSLRNDNTGFSGANAVNADGSVVVGQASTDLSPWEQHAFVWREGDAKMTDLGTLKTDNSGSSSATAVSADGSTVVGSATTDALEDHAFVWREGDAKMTDLGTLKSDNSGTSVATSVSADGSTVVGASDTDSDGQRVFVWRSTSNQSGGGNQNGGQMQDLNHLLYSYTSLANQTEQVMRSQQKAMAYNLDQSCFADEAGANCLSSSIMLSQTPSTSGDGGIGRSTQTTGSLTYGRGLTDQVTVGAFVSAYGHNAKDSDINLGEGVGVGAFTQYSQGGKSRTGLQAGAAMMYAAQSMDIRRGHTLSNVQEGHGKRELQTVALQGRVGYGLELNNEWLLTPEAKLTYFRSNRSGYTETGDGLVFDTSYDKLSNDSTILSLGADMQRPVSNRSRVLIGAGVDVDLKVEEVSLSGRSNVFTLGNGVKEFNATSDLDRNKVRPYVQAGYSYDLSNNKGTVGIGTRVSMPEYSSGKPQYQVGLNYTVNF